jgi:hypothetical protein
MLWDYLNGKTEGLLFPAKNGKPLRNNNVLRRQLHPLLAKIGIAKGGMHGFRHGRVWFLVENDTPVEHYQGLDRSRIGEDDSPLHAPATAVPQPCFSVNSLSGWQQN